jgi:hypothetical protein
VRQGFLCADGGVIFGNSSKHRGSLDDYVTYVSTAWGALPAYPRPGDGEPWRKEVRDQLESLVRSVAHLLVSVGCA